MDRDRKTKKLSDTAIMQIPNILGESTKKRLIKLLPVTAAEIIALAVDEITRGSMEPLNTFIKEKL